MSGGRTPEIRDACPTEMGRITLSFSFASAGAPGKPVPVEVPGNPFLLHAPEASDLLFLAGDVPLVLDPCFRQGKPRAVRGGLAENPGRPGGKSTRGDPSGPARSSFPCGSPGLISAPHQKRSPCDGAGARESPRSRALFW